MWAQLQVNWLHELGSSMRRDCQSQNLLWCFIPLVFVQYRNRNTKKDAAERNETSLSNHGQTNWILRTLERWMIWMLHTVRWRQQQLSKKTYLWRNYKATLKGVLLTAVDKPKQCKSTTFCAKVHTAIYIVLRFVDTRPTKNKQWKRYTRIPQPITHIFTGKWEHFARMNK